MIADLESIYFAIGIEETSTMQSRNSLLWGFRAKTKSWQTLPASYCKELKYSLLRNSDIDLSEYFGYM